MKKQDSNRPKLRIASSQARPSSTATKVIKESKSFFDENIKLKPSSIKKIKIKRNAQGKPVEYVLRDIDDNGNTWGFYIRVRKTGNASYYLVKRRGGNGKLLRRKVGDITDNFTDVKNKAKDWVNIIANGDDPYEEKREKIAEHPSLLELFPQYIKAGGSRRRGELRPKTINDYRKTINHPHTLRLAKIPVNRLKADAIVTWYRSKESSRQIDKSYALMKAIADYAKKKRLIFLDPFEEAGLDIQRYVYKKKESYVEEQTIEQMLNAFEFIQFKNDPVKLSTTVKEYYSSKEQKEEAKGKIKAIIKKAEAYDNRTRSPVLLAMDKIWTNKSRGNASKELDQTVFHMFLFMITHGTRIWETQRMTWEDLEFKNANNSVITIPPEKTKMDQILKLPIIPFTNLLFKIRYNSPNKHEKWVFPNSTGTNYISYGTFNKKLDKARAIGQVTNPNLYTTSSDWRSFTIDTMVKNGIDKDLRMSITNHKNKDAHDLYFRDNHSKFSEILNKNVEFVSKLIEVKAEKIAWNKEIDETVDQKHPYVQNKIYRLLANNTQYRNLKDIVKDMDKYTKILEHSKKKTESTSQDDWSI